MKRNVIKFAEYGKNRATDAYDIYSHELQQLYTVANISKSPYGALWEVMTTAFYFGYEAGALSVELPPITDDTTVSQLREMLDQATPEQRTAIKDIIANQETLTVNEN